MRALTLAAVGLLTVPAALAAQAPSLLTYRSFGFQSCGGGIVQANPPLYSATAVCISGVATVASLNGRPGVLFNYARTLDARLQPLAGEYGAVSFRSSNPICGSGCIETAAFFPRSGGFLAFNSSGLTYDLSTVELLSGQDEERFAPIGAPYADSTPLLSFGFTAVPEPATLTLTFGGLAVLGGFAVRRRRA